MANYRICLIEFSMKKENGARDTLSCTEIANCHKRGNAELIAYKIKDTYSCFNSDFSRENERVYMLNVIPAWEWKEYKNRGIAKYE